MLLSPRRNRFMGSGVYAESPVRKTMFLVTTSCFTVRHKCLRNFVYSFGSTANRSPALKPPNSFSLARSNRELVKSVSATIMPLIGMFCLYNA